MARRVGGASPADVNDPSLVAVFQQALASHNASAGTDLVFVSVESATKQVVSGFSFKGVLNVTNDGEPEQYNVSVWEKAGGQEIEVSRFEKI